MIFDRGHACASGTAEIRGQGLRDRRIEWSGGRWSWREESQSSLVSSTLCRNLISRQVSRSSLLSPAKFFSVNFHRKEEISTECLTFSNQPIPLHGNLAYHELAQQILRRST